MADCPYYPRMEDWMVYDALDEGYNLLLAGPRGSGVSTLIERASRLSKARVVLARSAREALEACRGGRVAVDLGGDLRAALEVLKGCEAAVAGVSLGLAELAALPAAVKGLNAEVVILKPLTPGEAVDYLSKLGVKLDESVAEELVLRSGGYPGILCTLAPRLKGRMVTPGLLARTIGEPPWIAEARQAMGERFKSLAVSAFALALTEAMARELGVDPGEPWLEWSGGTAYFWGELAWLHPFAAKALGAEEAGRIYSLAKSQGIPGRILYTQASTLLKMTGLAEYAADMLRYGREAYEAFEDPWAKARVASSLAKAAEALGDARGVLEWLARLADVTPAEVSSVEVSEAVSMAKRAYEALRDPNAYSETLYSIARLVASRRMVEELNVVIDELEVVAGKSRAAEARYVSALLLKDAVVGDWLRASRLASEVLAHDAPVEARRLALLSLILARRGIPGWVELDADMAGFKAFMEEGRDPGDPVGPLTALAHAVSLAARGERVESGDHVLDSLLTALAHASRGDVQAAARTLEPLIRGQAPLSPIAFAADVITMAAEAASGRWGGAEAARLMAESAEYLGNPAAWILRELASAIEARDAGGALRAAGKAVALALLTVSPIV